MTDFESAALRSLLEDLVRDTLIGGVLVGLVLALGLSLGWELGRWLYVRLRRARTSGIHSIPEAKAGGEVLSRRQDVFSRWPFAGAERVPVPPSDQRLDGFSEAATLECRGEAPGDPIVALQHAQTPLRGSRVT